MSPPHQIRNFQKNSIYQPLILFHVYLSHQDMKPPLFLIILLNNILTVILLIV